MLYLLDANVFIDANRVYPIGRFPEFWEWLEYLAQSGRVGVPLEIFEEVVNPPPARQDEVSEWLNARKDFFLLNEEASVPLVSRVIEEGYAANLTDIEYRELGMDPFLISYALVKPTDRVIVSNEVSRPNKQRANRKIPDVCNDANLNVRCINVLEFIEMLDFRTDWRSRV